MKKSRLLAGLLIMTMLSTCIISGTFAKYVTEASGKDSARVAKWGVQLTVNANNFAKEYVTDDTTGTDIGVSVKADEKVVAPGTSSAETGCQAAFAISGSPEVVTKVQINLSDVKDVYLPAGEYKDYTSASADAKFTVPTGGYYPVVWTLKQGENTLVTGKLADIKTYLDAYNADKSKCTYSANQSLAASFTLDWAWDFDAAGAGTNDKADTLLGNVAAGTATVEGAVTAIGYSLTVTATQVD